MWNMKNGSLVLTEAEWKLFSTGLNLLRDLIDEDIREVTDDSDTGVSVFDHLTPEQKLVLLADTAYALVDLATPIPVQTAANEGAIAAVISMVWVGLETELVLAGMEMEPGDDKPVEIRRLLRSVFERSKKREEPLPNKNSIDLNEWGSLFEEFKHHIFWDTDFAMGDVFLDLPPEVARESLHRLGIDPDYFLAIPDEPDWRRLIAARQTLARLLGHPVVDDDGHYPAFIDLYHNLIVGPYSPEEIVEWHANPWVQIIGMTVPDWDCDFARWKTLFGEAVPNTPFQLAAAATRIVYEMPSHLSIERCGDNWCVRNEEGSFWCGLVENCWTDTLDNERDPVLAFATEAEAREAYVQADRMYDEREKRREQAMKRIRSDDPPMQG